MNTLLCFRIAELIYSIDLSEILGIFADANLSCYRASEQPAHISTCFAKIHQSDLTNLDDHVDLGIFHSIESIGDRTKVVPMMVPQGQEEAIKPFVSRVERPSDLPILRSPIIQARLRECLPHASQTVVIAHALTVEIRDYIDRRADIFYVAPMHESFDTPAAENAIEILFRAFMPDFDTYLIHSAGVIRHNRAVLFLAPNGGGKSSIAFQVPPETVLSDDQVAVSRKDGKFLAHSTPWGRIANPPMPPVELGALILVEKSATFELLPVKPRVMLEYLWNEHDPYNSVLPPGLRMRAFDLLAGAVHAVPAYRMRVPLGQVDWDAVDACLE